MNAIGSAVSRAPVFWLIVLGATLKQSNEYSYPTIKKCILPPFYILAALYGQLVFTEKKCFIVRRGKKRETRPCGQWWRIKSALLCQLVVVPWGSYHIYLWITEGSCYINLILTIQEQFMKELVWKFSAAVIKLFKVSCNFKSQFGPSIPQLHT